MTTTSPAATPAVGTRTGRWIDRWEPEDAAFWEATGKRIARRNLAYSIVCDHLGFCVFSLWTVIVLDLADAGLSLPLSDQFLLIAVPNLIGSLLRVPYTFAVPRFGGRAWTTFSAVLLLIPCLLVAVVVPSGWLAGQSHATQLWVLLACAATAGFGGGNFSSSMANISFFYPEARKGLALGCNAAGGNLGVAVAQLVIPLVVILGVPAAAAKLPVHQVHIAYAGAVWMPFIVLAALGAWLRMDSLSEASADTRSYRRAAGRPQTWIVSLIYIGTFGSFLGYSFALPLVIKNTFPSFLAHHTFIATYLAGLGFMGALLGSVARPLGGRLADRLGGASVTVWCFAGMAVFTATAMVGVDQRSFALFFASYMVVFVFSGAGNGSVYRMIPSIYAVLGRRAAGRQAADAKRQAAAAIGIAGAVGAFGGFLIELVFHQASVPVANALAAATKTIRAKPELAAAKAHIAAAHATWSISALWVFLGAYLVLGALTWFCYLRRTVLTARFPSLAAEVV